MVFSSSPYSPDHPALYDDLADWASHARQRLLAGIALVTTAAWGLVLWFDWRYAVIAGILLTATSLAGWGLVQQRTSRPHSAVVALTQVLLAVVGTISAAVSGFAFLLWMLGPAPVL